MSGDEDLNRQIIQRSSEIMLEDFRKFKSREVEIDVIVRSFKYYIRDLEARMPDYQELTSRLFDLWLSLEVTFAMASSREQEIFDAEAVQRIDEAVLQACDIIRPLAYFDSNYVPSLK